MKKRILNKKGFAIVETVMAMTIVSLVTITAVMLFFSSVRTTQSAVHKAQAQYFAEDAFACFRAADTADQFSNAMENRGGFMEFSITGGNKYCFTLNGSRFEAVAFVDYPAEGRASFRIEITDGDEVVASISEFKKGA